MTELHSTATRRSRRRVDDDLAQRGPGALSRALEPVADALLASARSHAEKLRSVAVSDERAELARAHAEAERAVAEGRTQGASAADWVASLQLAATRREAREVDLAAQRRAYEKLRHDAVEALVERASTPEGRALSERLAALVGELMNTRVPERPEGPPALELELESLDRRVSIGPGALVDHVLSAMSDEVESLWV